ncbi:MAG TPA: IPT/TIG domain-containing protein [Ignavibacteriaceae bacterium]|nr:IPT/TIG domain-containing protein [Ignavibacteriaceae bacterium]
MNKKIISSFSIFFIIFFIFFLNSCKEYDDPPLIYNPQGSNVKGPVIHSIVPSGTAVAGVREMTIIGQNFTSGDTTWIFIGNNDSPIIKSMSDDSIVIYRPRNSGLVDIKVVVPTSIDFVSMVQNYNIEAPIDSIQAFLVGSGLPNFTVMEIDKNGKYWTAANRRIDTTTADGLFFGIFKDRTRGLPTAFATVTDLKFGRGGALYACVGRADIYRISTAVADSNKPPLVYANLSGGTAVKFDFDDEGNIYAGGTGGLYIVSPLTDSTGTVVSSGQYTGITFIDLRVFGNYVYVADSKNLWRSSINGGTLGTPELLANLNAANLDSCTIISFNLDIDGRVYLCLQNAASSVYVLENDNSITPFYVDNILPHNVKQILWGYNSRYLYLNRSGINNGMRLYFIGMEKIGAPYNGRNF